MNYIKKIITTIGLVMSIQCGITVQAAGTFGIVETFTGERSVSLYVKEAPEGIKDASVQIGTSTGTVISVQPITQQEVSMKTLVMVDNSLSIKKEDRERVADFLQNLISDRDGREEMAITVFSEDITWMTEYTGDYSTLKQAADGIEYQDQETYLTDVLYDLITKEFSTNEEDVYHRIIIVSDGVDNKSLGYTKEELYSLLKDNPYPIYTIGCVNGKNDEELENMFALSRMTSAESFLLSEVENTLSITDSLKEDRNIVRVEVVPASEVMDGGKKAVRLSLGKGSNTSGLSADVVMPQQTQAVDEQPKSEPGQKKISDEPLEPEAPVQQDTDQGRITQTAVFIIIFCFIVVAAVIILTIRLIIRRRKDKKQFETIDDIMLNKGEAGQDPAEKTEFVMQDADGDGENTYCIWSNRNTCNVVLTDMQSTVKSFQAPMERSIIIGRKQGVCNIVLDYDKSVSNRHCEVSVKGGKFYIKDLQSSNGTFVNGNRVVSEIEIFSGNIIKLGRLEMKFEVR